MMISTRLVIALAASALFPSVVSAASISGRITDASNGEPVVFATVRLLELGTEVHTDADGHYVFEGIAAGRYTVAVSFAGYSDYSIGVVEVQMEGQKTLDAALQPDVAPMYQRDSGEPEARIKDDGVEDKSIHSSPIRLADLPIRGYDDYIAIQNGTVRRYYGAPVHVRGGRIEEFAYEVDGFSQQDPFTGRSFTAINGNSVDDVSFHPGYSDPSNGWLASGHAEVTTKETWSTGGSFEAITDNFHGEKSDYNLYALDLSGPLLSRTPGQLTYAIAGEYRTFGTRDVGGPDDWNYLGAWHVNLRWRPTERTSTLFGTRGSYEDWKYTPREWYFNSEHAPRGVDENYSVFGTIEHVIAHNTEIEASVNWFSAKHRQGDGVHFDDIWTYGRPEGNPRSDQTNLFFSWDDIYLDQENVPIEDPPIPLYTPVVESTYTVSLPGGSSEQHSFIIRGDEGTVWDDYLEQKGSYLGGKFELEHSHSRRAETEIGIEFQRHTTRAYHHLFPVLVWQGVNGGFDDIDRYGYDEFGEESDTKVDGVKHPFFFAGYLNESLELRDLTLNFGLRWDRFDYDATGLVDPQQPLDPYDWATYADTASGLSDQERNALRQGTQRLSEDELTEIEAVNRLSPRISASLPVAPSTTLHFGAGRFVQRPALNILYTSYDYLEYKLRTGGYKYVFANPTLEPTESISFEVGVSQRLGDDMTANASVYTKEFKNLVGATTQPAIPNSFSSLADAGEATVKGLELELRLAPARGTSIQARYTLSNVSDDERSLASTNSNIAWTVAQPRKIGGPFTFEQKHRFIGVVDLRTGPEDGPMIGESYPLSNAGITFLFEAGSGFPYSPVVPYNEVTLLPVNPQPSGPIGSESTPAVYRLDLKANKSIAAFGADLEFYLWVINLFDRDNVSDVYRGTGEPDNTGWLDTPDGQQFVQENADIHDSTYLTGEQKYQLRQNDPANFDIPRQIRFGMRVGF
jgi:outer membrane receptor protein involved in Fe transport